MRLVFAAAMLPLVVALPADGQFPASRRAWAQPDLEWGPAPVVFPAGAQMAVMQGDPASTGMFTIRLRLPDGYTIAPHTHPTDEHITVISGTFKVGMGTTFDRAKLATLHASKFVTARANHAHYATAQGTTIVQIHAMGPFSITYMNPADAPRVAVR